MKSFLTDAAERGHREQGLIGLRIRVPKFFVFCSEHEYELEHIGVKEAQEYQGWLLASRKQDGSKYSSRTIA